MQDLQVQVNPGGWEGARCMHLGSRAISFAAAEAHTAGWRHRRVHCLVQDSELCPAAGKHQHANGEPERRRP